MKKLSISLALMGMTSLGFAQNSYSKLDQALLNGLGTLASNYEYHNGVQNNLTPNHVKYLENVVSYWDVTELEKFKDHKGQPFEITFKSVHGNIVVSYDSEGKILTAMERFENFALPRKVNVSISKSYPDWKRLKTRYSLFYSKDSGAKKRFKVQISKGGQKKWLKVD